jgi:hypothetical protein
MGLLPQDDLGGGVIVRICPTILKSPGRHGVKAAFGY